MIAAQMQGLQGDTRVILIMCKDYPQTHFSRLGGKGSRPWGIVKDRPRSAVNASKPHHVHKNLVEVCETSASKVAQVRMKTRPAESEHVPSRNYDEPLGCCMPE